MLRGIEHLEQEQVVSRHIKICLFFRIQGKLIDPGLVLSSKMQIAETKLYAHFYYNIKLILVYKIRMKARVKAKGGIGSDPKAINRLMT